jgi:hypothetical protein
VLRQLVEGHPNKSGAVSACSLALPTMGIRLARGLSAVLQDRLSPHPCGIHGAARPRSSASTGSEDVPNVVEVR